MLYFYKNILLLLYFVFILSLSKQVNAIQSLWRRTISQADNYKYYIHPNYLYQDAYVTLSIICYSHDPIHIKVNWVLQEVHCMEEMYSVHNEMEASTLQLNSPMLSFPNTTAHVPIFNMSSGVSYTNVTFQNSYEEEINCGDHTISHLRDQSNSSYHIAAIPDHFVNKTIVLPQILESYEPHNDRPKQVVNRIVSAWKTGMYHFLYSISTVEPNASFEANVNVEMHGRSGYLSAIDWPALPFNIVMAILYLIAVTVWVVVWARSHRHTLKIHVVIGIVTLNGAMAHILQFLNLAAVNTNSAGIVGLLWLAYLLSAVQIAMFHLLIIIISIGHGITRPTVSRGILYAIVSVCSLELISVMAWRVCVDESMTIQYNYPVITKIVLWTLSSCYVFIAAWVMIASIQTFRELLKRRHSTHVISFTIFSITSVISFVGQIVVFSISMGWMTVCRTHWQYEWFITSFSSMQALVLLTVLMILWRPVDAAQSYAFTPLIDELEADSFDSGSDVNDSDYEMQKIKLEPL